MFLFLFIILPCLLAFCLTLFNLTAMAKAIQWIRKHPLGEDCRGEFRPYAQVCGAGGVLLVALVLIHPLKIAFNSLPYINVADLGRASLFPLMALPLIAPALALHPRLTPQRRPRR